MPKAQKTKPQPQQPKPELDLGTTDGNAFSIIMKARKVGKAAGWSEAKIESFSKEAKSGDYAHVLQTCMEHFDVI
jgi:hypothetical protein